MGVLASVQLQLPSDVVVLAESYPELVQQFYDLRDQHDRPSNDINLFLTEQISIIEPENRCAVAKNFDS